MHENVHISREGMGAEFRSHFVFILLVGTALSDKSHSWIYYEKHHRKKSYERYCSDSKNYRLRKVKSGKVVLYSLLEFSEAVTIFVPPTYTIYLPQSGNIVEPEVIKKKQSSRKWWKYISWREKRNENGDIYINFFQNCQRWAFPRSVVWEQE